METKEFNQILREKNKKYRDVFGYIPCLTDYSCTRDEYLSALDNAVAEKKELDKILPKYSDDFDGNVEI